MFCEKEMLVKWICKTIQLHILLSFILLYYTHNASWYGILLRKDNILFHRFFSDPNEYHTYLDTRPPKMELDAISLISSFLNKTE